MGADGLHRDVDTIIFGTGFHTTDAKGFVEARGALVDLALMGSNFMDRRRAGAVVQAWG